MPVNVVMPKWGLTMKQGKITAWLVKEGDTVRKGQELFEVETEKITNVVESSAGGILFQIIVPAGTVVATGTIVAIITEPGEQAERIEGIQMGEPEETAPAKAASSGKKPEKDVPKGFIPASPVARRLAKELGIDLGLVPGSGPGGRVTEADVKKYHKEGPPPPKITPLALEMAKQAGLDIASIRGTGEDGKITKADVERALEKKDEPEETAPPKVIPFTGMRKTVADNMYASLQNTAQLTAFTEVDVTEMVRFLSLIREEYKRDESVRVSYNDIIILATGSILGIPSIPGIEEAALTTDQVLDMTELPSSILIWGSAGPIEVEMATLLNSFGCKVFLASETRRILPREDGDTSQRVAQALREQGVEIIPRARLASVRKSEKGYTCILDDPDERTVEVEKVLVCGRKPNTQRMGLDQADISLNEDGGIQVNDKLETTAKGIYAIGDVTGGWFLSHAASSMAIVAAENAMGAGRKFPHHLIPRGIWSIPQVGSVGLSEEDAEEKGIDVEVGDFPYSINGLGMCRGEMSGAVKVVTDSRYGEILGVHIVGTNATELVGEAVMAMQLEATVNELAASIRVHPTFSESVVDAARDARGWALYLPKR